MLKGRNVNQGEHVAAPLPARASQCAGIRRPRRVFAFYQWDGRATCRLNNVNLEISGLHRESKPFAVRRPIRLGRAGGAAGGDLLQGPARRSHFAESAMLLFFGGETNPSSIWRPAGRGFILR